MGAISLIRRALHPGTTLAANNERLMPVDALMALAWSPPTGAALIHARQGHDDIAKLRRVVMQVAEDLFSEREWVIYSRKRFSPAETMALFVEQVWREYMGEPCGRCKGHGVTGRRFDTIRHKLDTCKTCAGRGFQVNQHNVRRPCETCHGKALVEIREDMKASRLRACAACFGSGSVPATVRARARTMHIDNMTAGKVWQPRFRAVLATLRTLEMDALIVCRERLYGDDLNIDLENLTSAKPFGKSVDSIR